MINTHLDLKLFIIVFFLIFKNNSVPAQKLFLTPEETFTEATEYILSEEPEEALPLFFEILGKGYNTATVNYHIGKCLLMMKGQKKNALSYLERAENKISKDYIGKDPSEDAAPVSVLKLLGEACRVSNDFDRSIRYFTLYSENLLNDSIEKNLARVKIRQCENARDLLAAKINLKKTKLGEMINTGSSNTNPVLSADEGMLFFNKELKFYDALMRTVKISENWTEPENLTPEIKSDGDYLVTGVSSEGNALFLYTYNNLTKGDIYSTSFNGKTWSDIKKLSNKINTVNNETSASISADGKTLYFTSNKKGGYGGLDIYKSKLDEKGEWGTAENLGPVINSVFDENYPFINKSKDILYFCSQGHYNMGGYDIFFSKLTEENTWQNPLNIGYPLNTTDDDELYFPLGEGRTGYHSELNETENNKMEIYRYELLSYANPSRFKIKGKVEIPDNSDIAKKDITVSFLEKQNEKETGKGNCDSAGNYTVKLPAGNFMIDFSTSTRHLERKELFIPEYMDIDEIILESKLDFETILPLSDTFSVSDILFSFDKYSISETVHPVLTSLVSFLQKYSGVTVKLIGYTDSKGKESYNQLLSEKRAGEIKIYLVNSAIAPERVMVEGLGEDSPVATNENSDGTDNAEGRKYNRRVEIHFYQVPENVYFKRTNLVPAELMIKK